MFRRQLHAEIFSNIPHKTARLYGASFATRQSESLPESVRLTVRDKQQAAHILFWNFANWYFDCRHIWRKTSASLAVDEIAAADCRKKSAVAAEFENFDTATDDFDKAAEFDKHAVFRHLFDIKAVRQTPKLHSLIVRIFYNALQYGNSRVHILHILLTT